MSNMISWFEIPAVDLARARKFYAEILGAEVAELDLGDLKMGLLGDSKAGVAGAIVRHQWYTPSEQGVLVYLSGGDDLSKVLSKVEGAGGTVVIPKRQISPDFGFMAVFKDTEGNRIALQSPH